MMADNKNVGFWVGGIIILLLLGFVTLYFTNSFSVANSSTVQLAIPHFASYKCEPIGDKTGLSYTIPASGLFISQSNVGFYTDAITNLQTSVSSGFWSSLTTRLRLRYMICDVNGNNCGAPTIINYYSSGVKQSVIQSIDLSKYSIKVFVEQQSILQLVTGSWSPFDKATLTYDGKAWGLTLPCTLR